MGLTPEDARIARQFIEAIPFSRALGMRLDEIGDGVAVISMPYAEALVGEPRTGVIHGGAVSALMDTCGGAAVMSHPEALSATATIDLQDRLHAAGDAPGSGSRRGRSAITSRARWPSCGRKPSTSDASRPVASATGAFTVERRVRGMSARRPPEPVEVVKQRRDRALSRAGRGGAVSEFMGIGFDRRGDELTAVLSYTTS
jgi:acyl-coenzyme A thioesterase PaaI-like protein